MKKILYNIIDKVKDKHYNTKGNYDMTKFERATVVNTLNMLNMILAEKVMAITEIVYTVVDDGKAVKWFMPVYDSTGKSSDADLVHDLKVYTDKLIQYEANKYLEAK